MEADEYRERNRQFKGDLQEALGADGLAQFKECSAEFRRLAAQAGSSADRCVGIAKYAEQLLAVFSAGRSTVGDLRIAKLLSDLVVLLPDKQLRHDLYNVLRTRQRQHKASTKV